MSLLSAVPYVCVVFSVKLGLLSQDFRLGAKVLNFDDSISHFFDLWYVANHKDGFEVGSHKREKVHALL